MFVKSIMIPKHKCFYVEQNETLEKAHDIMMKNGIDGMPVIHEGKYAGVVTKVKIYEYCFFKEGKREALLKSTKVSEVAFLKDVYLQGQEIFENMLSELRDVPILAVVDEELNFLGIVSRADTLKQLRSSFGMDKKGIRIALASPEGEGRLLRLTELAKQYHENIISLATFDETDKIVRRIVIKIDNKENVSKFLEKAEKSGFKVLTIHEM